MIKTRLSPSPPSGGDARGRRQARMRSGRCWAEPRRAIDSPSAEAVASLRVADAKRAVFGRCRLACIAVLVAFLILVSAPGAVSASSAGRPVADGQWRYQGQFGVQGSSNTYTNIQFFATLFGPLPGGRSDVKFGGVAGQLLGSCTGGVYRNGNLMDFWILNVRAAVGANGKFSISQRPSNGSLGPGTVKITGSFIGTNGPRWAATIEVTQHQIGHGTCTAKREFRATRRERTG